MIVQILGSQPAPISTFENQPRWNYLVESGDCTKEVRDDIAEYGCGGGSVVAKPSQHMSIAYDREDLFRKEFGTYEHVLAWANHDCTCPDWPHCNGVAAQFLQ